MFKLDEPQTIFEYSTVFFVNKVDFEDIAARRELRENPSGKALYNPIVMLSIGQFEGNQFFRKYKQIFAQKSKEALDKITSDWKLPYHKIGRNE